MFDRDEFTTDSFMNPHQLRPHMLNNLLIKIPKTEVAVEELYICCMWGASYRGDPVHLVGFAAVSQQLIG